MANPFWNPALTRSPNQQLIPPPERLPDYIPYQPALPTDIFLDNIPLSKTDGYLDDGITTSLDFPIMVGKAEAALPLALHLLFCPLANKEPITCTDVLSLCKLAPEGTMRELIKYIGWLINTCEFTIALPQGKALDWLNLFDKLISNRRSSFKELES
eukprot:3250116-Ditylum_brightwellii.AAC.1